MSEAKRSVNIYLICRKLIFLIIGFQGEFAGLYAEILQRGRVGELRVF